MTAPRHRSKCKPLKSGVTHFHSAPPEKEEALVEGVLKAR